MSLSPIIKGTLLSKLTLLFCNLKIPAFYPSLCFRRVNEWRFINL